MFDGPPPHNATHVMRLRCDEQTARDIADLIVETYDPSEAAAAAFEEKFNTQRWVDHGPWIVEVYFGFEPDQAGVRDLVACVAGAELAASAEFSLVSQDEWLAASFEGLEAVREGRFVVHGAHARDRVTTGDIGIEIEAALAFGTGHHGSTRGCLAMLNDVARRRRPLQRRRAIGGLGIDIGFVGQEKFCHILASRRRRPVQRCRPVFVVFA